jgi:hypothetical protein
MDEELDLAPRHQEGSSTITDETRQAACVNDTPDQGTLDRTLDDAAGCSLRIKKDRRDGHTGIYLGFERRGRLNFRRAIDPAVIAAERRWISGQ